MTGLRAAASLLGLLCVAGWASGGASAGPRPPVIHEPFTLLPCPHSQPQAGSTIGMEGCQEHAIVKSDRTIDALAALVHAKLQDDPARRRFVAGERAWLAYRTAFCRSQSDVYEGGTASPMAFGACVLRVNAQHVTALTAFHRALSH